MSKGKVLFYLSVIVILLVILVYLLIKPPSADNINKQIFLANFCGSSEDCQQVRSKCPFECPLYVSNNDVERIQDLIDNYKSDCSEICRESSGVACINNKCVAQ